MRPAVRSRFKTRGGFTLIEVLVVVLIMAIISAMLLMSFGILGDDRALQQQARRMSSLIELATDEAIMQGRDFGLEFMQHGYRFVEHDAALDQWHEVIGDELLRPRPLEEGMEFELFLEGRPVSLAEEAADTDLNEDSGDRERQGYLPHVLILSSGEVTPFQLRLVRWADRSEVLMEMTLNGEFEINADETAAL
ncbi:MAG TPA: type II secretion system minor pseudopilin GspH [Woeseiaceae bacterium]|nr:type II secretion system minor pseudopilin GspH [Woeseiaceae bacterium]